MICWFKWMTLTDGSLRLNPLNPSKKNDYAPATHCHALAPLHKTGSSAWIQTLLSPHYSSDASVVSGNSLQKIEKWWPAAQGEPWDSAVLEKQFKEPVCPVWFITADYNRQVLRCNTPTECAKGRQIMRVVWIKVVVVGAKMDVSLTTQSREDDIDRPIPDLWYKWFPAEAELLCCLLRRFAVSRLIWH